jgi:hypothetical protein
MVQRPCAETVSFPGVSLGLVEELAPVVGRVSESDDAIMPPVFLAATILAKSTIKNRTKYNR